MRKLSRKEILKSLFIWGITFIILWTVTALWENPFFNRMTSYWYLDYIILVLESAIIGLYMGTRSNTHCDYSKGATAGWIFWFLGFGCIVCNKILLMIFWASFLLSYIEPIRYYIGLAWIMLMSYFLYKKITNT